MVYTTKSLGLRKQSFFYLERMDTKLKKFTEKEKKVYKENLKKQTDKMQNLITELAESYKNSPEDYLEFLEFSSKFYNYSIKNQTLIMEQNKGASLCGSFKFFKDLGYSVNRGEKAIKIFVPTPLTFIKIPTKSGFDIKLISEATPAEKRDYKNGLIAGYKKTSFKIGNIFDIGQTNIPAEDIPKIFNYTTDTKLNLDEQENILIDFAQNHEIEIAIDSTSALAIRGKYNPLTNSIIISDKLDQHARIATLSHEIGHALLHRHIEIDNIPTAHKELQADTISLLICNKLNIPITDSRKSHLAETLSLLDEKDNVLDIISPAMSIEKELLSELEELKETELNCFRQKTNDDYEIEL